MIIDLLKVQQPIGEFYIGVIDAKTLVNTVIIEQRSKNNNFFQRDDNPKRVSEIAFYSEDPDATFPTPIIIAVNINESTHISFDSNNNKLTFNEKEILGSAIDGQHRLLGLKKSQKKDSFSLPVVIMFDLDEWEKAYVFATVNSNQKQVQSSLIYDLFDIIETKYRSPEATCHILAKTFNSSIDSPFYNRVKMLGKKLDNKQFLSQGTFAKTIQNLLISKDPQQDAINIKNGNILKEDLSRPLRKYFIRNEDEVIYKILSNYFNAIKEVFELEWDNPDDREIKKSTGIEIEKGYILTRATGYSALIRLFVYLVEEAFKNKTLTKEFFKNKIQLFKIYCDKYSIRLDADTYPPSGKTEKDLSSEIIDVINAENNNVKNEIYKKWHNNNKFL